MAFRKILLPLNGRSDLSQTCDYAFKLALQFTSHVEALFVRPDPRDAIPLLGEGMSVTMIEDMIAISNKEADKYATKSRETFDQSVAGREIKVTDTPDINSATANWLESKGPEDTAIECFGKLADLIVVSRPVDNDEIPASNLLNTVLFETGRPVFVTPPVTVKQSMEGFPKHVAVFWNASTQSARAVGAALPFLHKAGKVTVFTTKGDDVSMTNSKDLVSYLAWHGIAAQPHFVDEGGRSESEALLEKATECGADLLVMGAYTHSRMRRLILGGMTGHVLDNSTIPLLMAH